MALLRRKLSPLRSLRFLLCLRRPPLPPSSCSSFSVFSLNSLTYSHVNLNCVATERNLRRRSAVFGTDHQQPNPNSKRSFNAMRVRGVALLVALPSAMTFLDKRSILNLSTQRTWPSPSGREHVEWMAQRTFFLSEQSSVLHTGKYRLLDYAHSLTEPMR